MKATIELENWTVEIDLADPIDISIPLQHGLSNPNCFFAPPPEIWPVRTDSFVGLVTEGSPVNFQNLKVNPHGNGTHTECVGHISAEPRTINQCLKRFHFLGQLVSIYPQKSVNGSKVIHRDLLSSMLGPHPAPAVIIRTLPNDDSKLSRQYSGSHPPFFAPEAIHWLVEKGVQHLLTDLPSVDPEEDGGALAAHRAFWQYPKNIRQEATITELVYVPEAVVDGYFVVNLQICSLEMDASPSKPILYRIDS